MKEYKSPRIVALEIEDFDAESGVDAIALVESPAIEEDFYYFSNQKFESYTDYPKAATENAKIALRWADENGWGDCGTPVGKSRANQLAKGEPISEETIARMAAFERHRQNSTKELGDGCGRLMWLAWGGDEGIEWAQRKLKQIRGEEELSESQIEELILEYMIEEYFNQQQEQEELTNEQQEAIIEHLESIGETEEELLAQGWVKIDDEQEAFAISSTPDQPSIDDTGERIYRYKYALKPGKSESSNSRSFCKRIMRADKLYRKEDINYMTITGENSQFAQKGSFTYDIFKYAGGKYCRHHWIKVPFKKSEVKSQFAKEAEEKHLIAGPLMIPRKLIYRFDEWLDEEFYVYFTEQTIEKIAYKYLMNKYQDQTNLEHSEDIKLKDVVLVESWLIEDPEKDKSYFLTGKKYPKGTWFGVMKVLNTTVWKEWVKTGRVKGFSVEGYFSDRIINAEKHKFYYRTTKGGTEIVIDHNSLVVFVLEDGERKSILADGDYELDNGKTLQVRDSKAVRGSF